MILWNSILRWVLIDFGPLAGSLTLKLLCSLSSSSPNWILPRISLVFATQQNSVSLLAVAQSLSSVRPPLQMLSSVLLMARIASPVL